jgi:hypothetical protein
MATSSDKTAPTPAAPALSDPHETHHCHICGAPNAIFGFGPPLTHRNQIDRMLNLTAGQLNAQAQRQML